MRLMRTLSLLLVLILLPTAALADKTITLTFTGDITLGGEDRLRGAEDSFHALYNLHGPEYFLSNFADFFAEDDLTIVNLEGVLTDHESLRPYTFNKRGNYFFRAPTEYVKVLTSASVEVATLSNNHMLDFGEDGMLDTIETLEKAGIHWTNTHAKNTTPLEQYYFYEKDGVTICIMSMPWDYYKKGDPDGCGAFMAAEIERIKTIGEADAVVAILHGGQEYGRHRTVHQETFTTMAFKAGADLVICHHPHVVMGMDVINNRSAFYSLGNFCFGGNRLAYMTKKNGRVQDAAPALVVRVVLTFEDNGDYKGQQVTLYPVQTTSVDRAPNDKSQINDFRPKFLTGPLAAHVLHLMQVDMNYALQDAQNAALKKLVISKEKELAAMSSSEGMSSLTLPFLPVPTPVPTPTPTGIPGF